MILLPASDEQQTIIKTLENYNVNVDAVAGSGKTTTNLHIAQNFTNLSILLLTYNKDLKFDSRKKTKLLNITNLDVHSYHSFCVNYYYNKAFDDTGIIKLLENNIIPNKEFNYDLIIIDEIQDLNILYYELICKIVLDNNKISKICILGDRNQCINKWNESDWRYIKYSDILFNFNEFEWKNLNLTTSFRVTQPIAKFVNENMLKENRMNAIKTGSKPKYIICDSFSNTPYLEVKYFLDQGYYYEDFFILAPSVKSINSPIRQLANILSNNGIPIYVPNTDDQELDKQELIGKIAFSTFHQAKGRERKIVIVFSFDESYFKFYAKNNNPYECPNELYVACTRSLEHLSLIHHYQNEFLPFLIKESIRLNTIYNVEKLLEASNNFKNNNNKFKTSVTDLTKHLPSKVMKHCLSFFKKTKLQDKAEFINIPRKTKQGRLIEGVSEITGIAIPSYFELLNKKTMSIYNEINKESSTDNWEFVDDSDSDSDSDQYSSDNSLDNYIQNIKLNKLTPSQLLFISNKWAAFKSGYNFKLNQITNYNWLTKENLDQCIIRLKEQISKFSKFEIKYTIQDEKELLNRELIGFFDCIENNKLWEIKCVKTIRNEHLLQLAIYMYMHKKTCKNILKFKSGDFSNKLPIIEGDNIKFKFNETSPFKILGTVTKILKNGNVVIQYKTREYIIKQKNIVDNLTFIERIEKIELQENFQYLLFNVLDNQIFKIEANLEELEDMIEYLIRYKYYNNITISDKQFLENSNKYYSKYYECN